MIDPRHAVALGCALALAACCAFLTPADRAEIANDAARIAQCQAEGRACKADGGADCWGVYDGCMRDAGLH